MQALQKKIILPVKIAAKPELLGKSYDILLGKLPGAIHFPQPSKHNDKVGINAPLMPPTPYDKGVLKLMDQDTAGAWLQWGVNSSIQQGNLAIVSVGGLILTLDGDYNSIDEIRSILGDIDRRFLEWYQIFGAWLDLLSGQDLNEAEPDNFISEDSLNGLWSVRCDDRWTNAGPSSIYLTTDIKSKVNTVTNVMVLEAVKRANSGEPVGFEHKLLIDARHRFNRGDFNGCCLYYGQYIEVTARYKIRDYFDSKGIDQAITNVFLESRAIFELLDSCKKFSIDMNLSNKQREEVCKIRNLTAHARRELTLHYAREMEIYASNVFEVSKPLGLDV